MLDTLHDHIFAGAVCAIFSLLAVSILTLDQKRTLGQYFTLATSAILFGAATPSAICAIFPVKWHVSIVVSLLEGYLMKGILIKLDKVDRAIPDADIKGPISDYIKNKIGGGKP